MPRLLSWCLALEPQRHHKRRDIVTAQGPPEAPDHSTEITITRSTRRRARVRLGGMSGRLLSTMAIVRSNADKGRDYIANFEPFAIDRLKSWPDGEPVEPDSLARSICEEWGIPSLPTAVGKILLRRAESRGVAVRVGDSLYVSTEALAEVPDLASQRTAMLARMTKLAKAVVRYASDVHGLSWTEKDASEALERLTDEFGAELALAKKKGGLEIGDLGENEALAVVHGFARLALDQDPASFEYMEQMVQGTMLVNAVYFEDVGHVSNKLPQLRVYLDTTPVLRALGLAADPVSQATLELFGMLAEDFKVPMFVFPHTVDEIAGVLDGVARALRRGRDGAIEQGTVGGRNREAIDALVRRGATAGEVEAMRAELETRIRGLGINLQETPPHVEKGHIDEERFDEVLAETVAYRWKGPREKDLRSLAAVDRLRGKGRPRDLSQANAIFVTANAALVRASQAFFTEADRAGDCPHAIHETALTAQLWVRAPHPPPDLPRKLLIADCYAALNPGPELWERWVGHIVRLRERGGVSDEQVQNLIYHQQAKSKLFEVTHGDPDAVGDETVAEVLDRFEAELRRPAEDEAGAERTRRLALETDVQHAQAERDELRGRVEELQDWKRDREESDEHRGRRLRLARVIFGYAGAALLIVAFVLLCIFGEIHGKAGWASAVTLLVFGTAASWSWGTRRSVKVPITVLVTVGAASVLFVNVFDVVPEHKPARHSPRAK